MSTQLSEATSRRAPRPAPKAMVGRQPIFDRHNRVVGYELSFRAAKSPAAEMTAEDETAQVINGPSSC